MLPSPHPQVAAKVCWLLLPQLHSPLFTSGYLALPALHPHPPILAVWHPLSSHPWGSWLGPSIADVVMSLAVPMERSGWACSQ